MQVKGLECSTFNAYQLTWNNKRALTEFIKECLDRALATIGWCNIFLKVIVEVLAARRSDHKPLWTCFKPSP